MKLHVTGDGVFWLESSYDERATPKAARFHWHPAKDCQATCVGCAAKLGKVWWTKAPAIAATLGEHADADARKALGLGATAAKVADAKDGIPDGNLQLAIVEALRGLDLAPKRAPKRKRDAGDDDEFFFSDVAEAILSIPFRPENLVQIAVLDWDVSSPTVISEICPDWDGESEEFDLANLTGIGCCPSLKEVRIDSFVGSDLRPLVALKQLKRLTLGSRATIKDLSPLLEIATLEEVSITNEHDTKLSADAVIAALVERGVDVKIGDKKFKGVGRKAVAAPVGAATPARLKQLEAAAKKSVDHRDHREAAATYAEAVRVREVLGLDPIPALNGLVDALRETKGDALPHQMRLAELLAAGKRSSEEAQAQLAVLAEALVEAKQWADAQRIGIYTGECVLRSTEPEMTWLRYAGKHVATAAEKTNDAAARLRGLHWVVLADEAWNGEPGDQSTAARKALRALDWDGAPEFVAEFRRACGTAKPALPVREPVPKSIVHVDKLGAGDYADGFYRLFTDDLAAFDPLVRDRTRGAGDVWVIGRNAYGMLLVSGWFMDWFGEVVVAARPDEPQPKLGECRVYEALGIRLPNRTFGRFSDRGPYDAWVNANGKLPADQILQQQGGKLVAVPLADYYAAWPVPEAPVPKAKKKKRTTKT